MLLWLEKVQVLPFTYIIHYTCNCHVNCKFLLVNSVLITHLSRVTSVLRLVMVSLNWIFPDPRPGQGCQYCFGCPEDRLHLARPHHPPRRRGRVKEVTSVTAFTILFFCNVHIMGVNIEGTIDVYCFIEIVNKLSQ